MPTGTKKITASAPYTIASLGAGPSEPLGQLVRRLRIQRGMTQRELADAAGYINDTLARVEQGRGNFSPRSAKAHLLVLARNAKVSFQEALDFFAGTGQAVGNPPGITPPLQQWLSDHSILHDAPWEGPLPGVESPVQDALDRDIASIADVVRAAVAKEGKHKIESILRTIADLPARAAQLAEEEGAYLTFREESPPVRRPDGHVEQRSTTISVRQPSTAAAPSTAKRHRRSAGA